MYSYVIFPLLRDFTKISHYSWGSAVLETYIESYVVRVWIVPQRFLDLSHYYKYYEIKIYYN